MIKVIKYIIELQLNNNDILKKINTTINLK